MSIDVGLPSALFNGVREYTTTVDFLYETTRIGSVALEGMPSLKGPFDQFRSVHDTLQLVPDSLQAASSFKNEVWDRLKSAKNPSDILTGIKEMDVSLLSLALRATLLTVDALTVVAFCGQAKLLNLGQLAGSIGQFQLFGVSPLTFVAQIALSPTISIVYICHLSLSSVKEYGIYKNPIKDDGSVPNDIERRQIRREALWKIARNVTRIAQQALIFTVWANPWMMIGFGIAASGTGMIQGLVATNSMRNYLNDL